MHILIVIALTGAVLLGCAPPGKSSQDSSSTGQDIAAGTPNPDVPPPIKDAPFVPPFPESAEKFNKPWNNPTTMIVIDAYQGNSIDWNKMSEDKRMVGVIHRSSIGLTVDTMYESRRTIAKQRGYLWGAYHLGKSGNAVEQAKVFLKTIGNPAEVLMILDLEDTSNSGMMNIEGAKQFMSYVQQQTGKLPVVYANHNVTKALNASVAGNPLFKDSRLWYARFRTNIPDFPAGVWPSYFLWQFSSEINCTTTGSCLYNVPGTKFDMDVNVFYGSKAALEYQWQL
jgi:GH25 family lysozyme M1 (1,4-beta-N-acetylmuramidase)